MEMQYWLLAKGNDNNTYRVLSPSTRDSIYESEQIKIKSIYTKRGKLKYHITGVTDEMIRIYFPVKNKNTYAFGKTQCSNDLYLLRSSKEKESIELFLIKDAMAYINILFPQFVLKDKKLISVLRQLIEKENTNRKSRFVM